MPFCTKLFEGVAVQPSKLVVEVAEMVDVAVEVEVEVADVVDVAKVVELVVVGLHEHAELYRAVDVPQPPVARVGKPVVAVLIFVV